MYISNWSPPGVVILCDADVWVVYPFWRTPRDERQVDLVLPGIDFEGEGEGESGCERGSKRRCDLQWSIIWLPLLQKLLMLLELMISRGPYKTGDTYHVVTFFWEYRSNKAGPGIFEIFILMPIPLVTEVRKSTGHLLVTPRHKNHWGVCCLSLDTTLQWFQNYRGTVTQHIQLSENNTRNHGRILYHFYM